LGDAEPAGQTTHRHGGPAVGLGEISGRLDDLLASAVEIRCGSVIACLAIILLGIRFCLRPRQATLDFGISADSVRGLTEIKGARDITSGVVPLVVWASAGQAALGWVLAAAAIMPIADALIVLTNGGTASRALGVHGVTAALLVAAGLVLALA
jgi:Domain of unknown function (DUF4267)